MARSTCSFCLSVAARTVILTHLSTGCAGMLLGRTATKHQLRPYFVRDCTSRPWSLCVRDCTSFPWSLCVRDCTSHPWSLCVRDCTSHPWSLFVRDCTSHPWSLFVRDCTSHPWSLLVRDCTSFPWSLCVRDCTSHPWSLCVSPTVWSPDQHFVAMLADVSRYTLGRTEGRGLGFGQFVRTHTGKCLKCQSSSDGHSDHNALCAGGR